MAPANRDPYVVLLRRELIRAQARLRRCERERDALRAVLDGMARKKRAGARKKKIMFPNNNS
jgi:Flp pilus assembly protein TadB